MSSLTPDPGAPAAEVESGARPHSASESIGAGGQWRDGEVLKVGPNRTVLLQRRDAELRVVKRFRAREWWRRPFDARRARGEWQALVAARASGLRVPEPLALERERRGWLLATEHISSRALDELDGRDPALRSRAGRIGRSLGRLLASCARAGLDHPDAHPGNVLVDRQDRCWLIDLAGAQLTGRPWTTEQLERVLIDLAADLRERWPPDVLARAFVELRRARGTGGVPDACRVASAAVERRRELVDGGLERWERESSRVEVSREGRVERRAARLVTAAGPHHTERGNRARGLWRSQARLVEHGIGAVHPQSYQATSGRSETSEASFALPEQAVTLAAARAVGRAEPVRALAGLVAELHDRGFGSGDLSPDEVYLGPEPVRRAVVLRAAALPALVDPGRDLLAFERSQGGAVDGATRARFLSAYVRASLNLSVTSMQRRTAARRLLVRLNLGCAAPEAEGVPSR